MVKKQQSQSQQSNQSQQLQQLQQQSQQQPNDAQPQIGQPAPDFELPATNGGTVKLSDYRGRKVVLYFYPKDMTQACTQQACDFRDAGSEYEGLNAVVLGVSTDELKRHYKFTEKYELPFLLLSDPDHRVCELYGVWQEKQLYGRTYMGIVRSTFLIDEQGRLAQEWRNIRVKGHVDNVRQALKEE
ncbi:thioredoxin-dependent thiol peroxidase [Cohnella cellulosilytica]|uniref:thioredoxin-dependent peroxiredoxin n=1 Tax=Cohnella cellulosilytica TaxID=986710 RepID=A0ABW2FID4_9BACL